MQPSHETLQGSSGLPTFYDLSLDKDFTPL